MNAPAPNTIAAPDEALSSLLGAVADRPEAARLVSDPAPPARDWKAVQAAIDEYLEGYELRLDEGCHTPTEFERFLMVDAIAGLMEDDDFINALYSAVTAAPAAMHAGDTQTDAARDVLTERQRQISAEGWTPQHDDKQRSGELALAASCYCEAGPPPYTPNYFEIPKRWPWDPDWWKPSDYRRSLVKAGALILAEIERLDRATITAQQGNGGEA